MFKLDERLKKIADLITFNSFADIGCDHGKLVAYKSDDCSKIIATDINEKCLAKTIKLLKENDLMNKVETRLGNGLDVIRSAILFNLSSNLNIEILQFFCLSWRFKLFNSFCLYLSYSFSCNIKYMSYFFKSSCMSIIKSISQPQNLLFTSC